MDPRKTAERGRRIYHERLKPLLEPENNGRIVAIDVDTGEYWVGDDADAVLEGTRRGDRETTIHLMRVGSEGAFQLSTVLSDSVHWEF